MKTYEFTRQYAKFFATRFDQKHSVYIRFDAVPAKPVYANGVTIGFDYVDDAIAKKIARRFRHQLNQFYFGNAARRYGKQAVITIALHKQSFWHFHIQAERPDHVSFLKVKSFTEAFVWKNSWLKSRNDGICYCAETKSDLGAQIYNSRFGSDSVIDF